MQSPSRSAVCAPTFADSHAPKLLFLVTEDWYFCSHRLGLAEAARRCGYDVVVATGVKEHGSVIEQQGLRLLPIDIGRRFDGFVREAKRLWRLWRLFRIERPDIVYQVGLKPVVYGSLAATLAGVRARVSVLAGLGYVFSSDRWHARLLRPIVRAAVRMLVFSPHSRVIVQNQEDRKMLARIAGRKIDSIVLIKGSGVDINLFRPMDEPHGVPIIVLASRMLWAKGVGDFVDAAQQLRAIGVEARFVLVGKPDEGNPTSISPQQLESWECEGVVERWGYRADMHEVFANCHVVCLPSTYGEGVPKVLIEAAASSRPIVATDISGCREIVRHGENGLLVPVHDAGALARAIRRLLDHPDERKRMGRRGREIAETEFSMERVNEQTLAVYRELLVSPELT